MDKRRNDSLFFDIETTGLSPDISAITVIGCCDGDGECIQWFNEDGLSQKEILSEFLTYCKNRKTLISFNGASFDLPFLLAKAQEYGLTDTLSPMEHLDLYRELRRCRHLFPFGRFRQKNFEKYLGFSRKDSLSGKQVIKTYQSWLETGDNALREQVLLHNREDLLGLRAVFQLLCYPALESGEFTVLHASVRDASLQAEIHLEHPFPVPARLEKDCISLEIQADRAVFHENLTEEGMLKHYYPNPKDYYYLPEEDIIIPKSMGTFVDKGSRIPASSSSCYSKFRPEEAFLSDQQAQHTFLAHNICYLMKKTES